MQVVAFASSLVIVLGVGVAAQFRWLGNGRVKTIVVFLAGVATILSLAMGGLPPWWFSGSKGAFGLTATLLISAFLGRTDDERSFAKPLFLGLGLTLLMLNLVQFARNVL